MAYRPNEINIESIKIYNFEGKSLELSGVLVKFEIQENIFQNTMRGSLDILNSMALVEKLPVIGEEFIILRFNTPGERIKEYTFYVESFSRKQYADRSEQLSFVLISIEELVDRFSSVDKSFKDTSIQEIVKAIYTSNIRGAVKYPTGSDIVVKKKTLTIAPTHGAHSYVSSHRPFEFMNYLATQAESPTYPDSDFIFFENYQGFYFMTVSELSKNEVSDSFYYGYNTNVDFSNSGDIKQYQVISSLTFSNSTDTVNNADLGLFSNQVCFFDPLTKTFKENTFNYYEDFDQSSESLASNKIVSGKSFLSIRQPSTPHTRFIQSSDIESYNTLDYVKNNDSSTITNAFRRHRFLNRLITKAALTNNTVGINFVIPGNTTLVAGNLVNVFVPEGSQSKESLRKFNYFFGKDNPKFLVTGLKHYYDNNQFYTILECVKAGYGRKIKSRDPV
jgi:hypothetical protein